MRAVARTSEPDEANWHRALLGEARSCLPNVRPEILGASTPTADIEALVRLTVTCSVTPVPSGWTFDRLIADARRVSVAHLAVMADLTR